MWIYDQATDPTKLYPWPGLLLEWQKRAATSTLTRHALTSCPKRPYSRLWGARLANVDVETIRTVVEESDHRPYDLGADITAIRAAHCHATSELPDRWTAKTPSTGQCHVTALILHERHGGRILAGLHADDGYGAGTEHYWNVIDGTTIDATRDQFPFGAVLTLVRDETQQVLHDGTRTKTDLLRSLAFGESDDRPLDPATAGPATCYASRRANPATASEAAAVVRHQTRER